MSSPPVATSSFADVLSRHWPVIALAGAFYILMSVRVARQMGKTGRSTLKWFFITFCLTAIPAAAVLLWDNFGWLIRGEPRPDDADACEGQEK